MPSSRPQRFAHPAGTTRGWITLSNGTQVWLEYLPTLQRAVLELADMKLALEDVVVRAAAHEGCDWVRVRSLFHPTTIKDDGTRTMDRGGHHVVVDMRDSTQPGGAEKAHVYADGFEALRTIPPVGTSYLRPGEWYNQVKFRSVRWESARTGSSAASSLRSGGATPASNRSGGSIGRPSQSPPNGRTQSQWVPRGNGEEQYYDGAQGKYINTYRKKNARGQWETFQKR